MADKQLTVAELIELLKKQPQYLPVSLEGCDCHGEATGVEHEPEYVLITRNP